MRDTLNRRAHPALLGGLLAVALLLAAAPAARSDDARPAPPPPPRYIQECAACHLAYPPGALPAPSWQRLMRKLSSHYGTDASVDAATLAELSSWLAANAGTWKRATAEPPHDRITRSAWFERKHREVAPATWARPAVKGPSNCAACHVQAERGDFDEHRVRIPR